MVESPKKVARQRRWAVCAAKVKSGAFSSLGGDSDSESDDGFGVDGSRFKLKACMSFSGNTDLPQPEEGDDVTTQSSNASTEGLSVDCATPVDASTTRPSPASPDLIGISLNLGLKEESPWELSSSSGESVHSTARSQTSAQGRVVPARSERGVCPESPGSYVTRMQRALLRIEKNSTSSSSSNANGNSNSSSNSSSSNSSISNSSISNGIATVNGTVSAATASSTSNGTANVQDCVGAGPTVGAPARSAGPDRSDLHDAESTKEASPSPDREQQEEEEDNHHHEMDLMIAAISTMIGMHIPEEARYVLWLVCCAIIVLIPGRRWGFFDPTLWGSPPSQEQEQEQGDSAEPGEEGGGDPLAPAAPGPAAASGREGDGSSRAEGEACYLQTGDESC